LRLRTQRVPWEFVILTAAAPLKAWGILARGFIARRYLDDRGRTNEGRQEHRVRCLAERPRFSRECVRHPTPATPTFSRWQIGKAAFNMAMAELLKRMEYDTITVHGFRSTFRDWAAERTNFPNEVARWR